MNIHVLLRPVRTTTESTRNRPHYPTHKRVRPNYRYIGFPAPSGHTFAWDGRDKSTRAALGRLASTAADLSRAHYVYLSAIPPPLL